MSLYESDIPNKMISEIEPHLVKVFGEMSEDEKKAVLEHMSWVRIKGRDHLFRQNDEGDALYILIHGRVKVFRWEGGKKEALAELSPGDIMGEMALISDDLRNADIVAIRDSHLVSISRERFEDLYAKFPVLGLNISRLLLNRLAPDPTYRKMRRVKNVMVIPGNRHSDVGTFMAEIQRLMPHKSIEIVGNKACGPNYHKLDYQGISFSEVVTLTDHMEKSNDLVFYRTDNEITEWTRFCLRQADEILIVLDTRDSVSREAREFVLMDEEMQAYISVVLLQSHGDLPQYSSVFFQDRTPESHFHLREHSEKDYRRIIRHLTDETTGLVLAGGGARGMAHLGVWKAIRELDLQIDMIGGTSMGAFMGGVMSFDWDFDKIYEICKEIAHSRPSSDFNPIPYVSLIRGSNLDRILKKYYLHHDIEDCIIPFYCISTNLTKVSQHVHTHGNMFKAIRASGSLPGVVPPVPIDQNWHVDGGIIENFPVEYMVERGIKKIIGVSFDPGTNPSTTLTEIPGFRRQITNGLLKSDPEQRIPSVIETVMLSTTAYSQSRQQRSEQLADILITPDVSQYGLLEWKAFEAVVAAGYEVAIRELG